jgi:hypothetical protein
MQFDLRATLFLGPSHKQFMIDSYRDCSARPSLSSAGKACDEPMRGLRFEPTCGALSADVVEDR